MPRDERYDEYQDQISLSAGPTENRTDSHQPGPKAALGVLLFLMSATLVFGAAKIMQDVRGPFTPKALTNEEQARALLDTAPDQKQEALKSIDTDGDGISNYDELNVYHTSPYLKDSDSDGIDDKEEIAKSTDPNCAEGQNCFRQDLAAADDTGTAKTPINTTSSKDTLSSLLGGGGLTPEQANGVINPSPDELRVMLEQSGISAEQLKGISDTALLDLYHKAIGGSSLPTGSQSTGSVSATTPPASSVGIDPEKLKNPEQLTTGEMRQVLLQSGKITQQELDAIDDESLRNAFLQTAQQTRLSQPAP